MLYHTYIKSKNTFLFFNNYFNMLQNLLQCVTHYKSCRKISKYLYLLKNILHIYIYKLYNIYMLNVAEYNLSVLRVC